MARLACFRSLTIGCLALSGMAGCADDEPTQTGTIPEQLESLEVAAAVDSGGVMNAAGTLAIAGNDREYTLSVEAEGAAPVSIAVHSPALTPLAALDGKAAQVELSAPAMGGRSLVVSDDAGALYVANAGDFAGIEVAEKALGADFATWGAEVGSETDGTFVWSYKKAVLATDAGPVEVLPGVVTTIDVDGAKWRVVIIASYTVEANPDADALPACSPEDMLAFEALRVEAAAAEQPVRRLAEAQVAFMGCTAPGGEE